MRLWKPSRNLPGQASLSCSYRWGWTVSICFGLLPVLCFSGRRRSWCQRRVSPHRPFRIRSWVWRKEGSKRLNGSLFSKLGLTCRFRPMLRLPYACWYPYSAVVVSPTILSLTFLSASRLPSAKRWNIRPDGPKGLKCWSTVWSQRQHFPRKPKQMFLRKVDRNDKDCTE